MTIDERPLLPLSEIRTFFSRRPWCRPIDWEQINKLQTVSSKRIQRLSDWINGYRVAKNQV